jgi:regulatory protein
LRLVAARARTEAEVRRRLERDGLGEVAAEVAGWLLRLGYLDDAAYARARARSLTAPGRLGPRLAERRLVSAGIAPPAARAAVAAALAEADLPGARGGGEAAEAALARALAEKRAGDVPLDALGERDRARLARFLLGRGFSGRAVSRVLGVFLDAD